MEIVISNGKENKKISLTDNITVLQVANILKSFDGYEIVKFIRNE